MSAIKKGPSIRKQLKFFVIVFAIIILILAGYLLKNIITTTERGLIRYVVFAVCLILSLDFALSYLWETKVYFDWITSLASHKYKPHNELYLVFSVMLSLLGFTLLMAFFKKHKVFLAIYLIILLLSELIFYYVMSKRKKPNEAQQE
ncbi:MAG: hypothetical protein GWN00_11535 [Aliifodinibius sp.]|nr:hypothetical protein [Fodinibius sp.]NIV11767.1 hypothetical protein [Fodinibius sp.]NIY25414.1 hypothetical protein [Fodinibius sp.]